jgi:glycosyltransferase involved in cell wall biosynthesis
MIKPPVRVAFVNHTAELGGGEIALLELIRNLDTARVQPTVILFSDGPLVPLLQEIVDVQILPLSKNVLKASKDRLGITSILSFRQVSASASLLFRLYRLLRTMRPQLTYTNSLKADILGGIAARFANIPVIWHVRDRISADYLPKKAVFVFCFLSKLIPDWIITNSFSTLSSLYPKDISAEVPDRISVIHDGVDVKRYRRSITRIEQKIMVGLIGRISPWKGQDVFIRAIRLITDTYPQVRFEIIGSPTFGEIDFDQKLRSLIIECNLTDVVKLAGFEHDIPLRINSLSIVVHASTIPEPFGQVVIEAMAAGKPVIATNGGGVKEIMLDGITGILVPMKDPESMAEAISKLLADPELCYRMGNAAYEHVQENFTISKTARAVENLILAMQCHHLNC